MNVNVSYKELVETPLIGVCEQLIKQIEYLKNIDILGMDNDKARNVINKINSLEKQLNTISSSLEDGEKYLSDLYNEIEIKDMISECWRRIADLGIFLNKNPNCNKKNIGAVMSAPEIQKHGFSQDDVNYFSWLNAELDKM